jgi:hypothetical protein
MVNCRIRDLGGAALLGFVQSTRRGPNSAVFVGDSEVEQAAIGHAKRQLGTGVAEPGNLEVGELTTSLGP